MTHRRAVLIGAVTGAAVLVTAASAKHFSAWGTPVNVEAVSGASTSLNTPFNDGCPIEAPDGRSLYIASNRPGGLGGQDIWVATRASTDEPWGAPENLGAPVNSPANDFCPTPLHGKRLLFVSERGEPGSCGSADIYIARLDHAGWSEPRNLGCAVNSAAAEAGPSLIETDDAAQLYFSSTRAGGYAADPPGAVAGDGDIYVSTELPGGGFGLAVLADGLNTSSDDFRPNVRHDGREVVFDSNRPGTLGGQDIWSSTRAGDDEPWSTPVDLASVNTPSGETRASLSGDGERLTFGSNRSGSEGMADVYFSTRTKLKGGGGKDS